REVREGRSRLGGQGGPSRKCARFPNLPTPSHCRYETLFAMSIAADAEKAARPRRWMRAILSTD
ncbi:MAG TPA: hypothetical protein PK400_07080, partial [Phycisphaerales bacterium]|nr:hypothetical protein [Phycisphaerales bacterium]